MQREKKKVIFRNTVIILLAVFLLGGFLINTVVLEKAMGDIVAGSVSDNNRQIAAHISYHLKTGSEFVTDFAATVEHVPGLLVNEEFLKLKQETMGFEELAVITDDNRILPESDRKEAVFSWLRKNPQVRKMPQITYLREHFIVFTAPFFKDGRYAGIVAAAQSYRELSSLIGITDYHGYGVCLLLDTEKGERILSSEDDSDRSFNAGIDRYLKTVGKEYGAEQVADHLADEKDCFAAVSEIENMPWNQVTLLSSDYLTSKVRTNLNLYFILLSAVVLLFMVIISFLIRENRKREQGFLTDSLTGGLNREGFLRAAEENGNEKNLYPVIVYLNVSDFKSINKAWGEEAGNQTLQFIYRTLRGSIGSDELVCRNGMDHYFMLLDEAEDEAVPERIEALIGRINKIICRKYSGYIMKFTSGICRPEQGELIAAAMNRAVYASRFSEPGRPCAFYDEGPMQKLERDNRLDSLFEESIGNGDFKIFLQPKVDPSGRERCQAEALVRWIHPDEGVVYPSDFIPLFERNGKICRLDLYVFEEVCRLMADWLEKKPQQMIRGISVNISRFHLKEKGRALPEKYREIKEKYCIPDGMIELELTETAFIDSSQLQFVRSVIDDFRSCGLNVALDDFGYAYSSLALLKEFDVNTMKLDRAFFVNENLKSGKIVGSMIQLAHSLDMNVVAEGIEHTEQVEMLRDMGCDLIQGYVFAKPMPADEFEAWRENFEKQQH